MQFVTANTNEAPQSAASYKIQSVPALIFLVNGKEVNRIEGSMTKGDFLTEISKAFAGAPQGAPVVAAAPAASGPSTGAILAATVAATGVAAGAWYLLSGK